mmetsp:Transcript_5103/g.19136  ORF Transcript_5103/g.19136 Transcript_5103/m.19136 type:complete len:526 (+) Transcript_5103:1842-3419(+)|eukprot:CAMPEP_0117449134 /NCGR_PEP_ID=MMETSP0759-20121206/7783_1 /TAXON_ID=63605 /ORGANISM="Percolomonas cosmopolitus, Strain WS" /LENGTH=525 /DNA_ID=CAMNT_0005241589 /DNA_START=765 /DNA_END=2342 /DNA_ORIENTATION=+
MTKFSKPTSQSNDSPLSTQSTSSEPDQQQPEVRVATPSKPSAKRTKSHSKSRSKRRQPKILNESDFISVQHLSQDKAAEELDICLSSFKRQLRNSGIRWKTPTERKKLVAAHHLCKRMSTLLDSIDSENSILQKQFCSGPDFSPSKAAREIHAVKRPHIHITDKNEIQFTPVSQRHSNEISLARFDCTSQSPFSELPQHPYYHHPALSAMEPSQLTGILSENHELKGMLHFQSLLINDLKNTIYSNPSYGYSNSLYKGDLSQFAGPWSSVLQKDPFACINVSDLSLHILSTSLAYRLLTGYTELDFIRGKRITDTMVTLFTSEYYNNLFQTLMTQNKKLLVVVDPLKRSDGTIVSTEIHIHFEKEYSLIWSQFFKVDNFRCRVCIDTEEVEEASHAVQLKKPEDLLESARAHVELLRVVESCVPLVYDGIVGPGTTGSARSENGGNVIHTGSAQCASSDGGGMDASFPMMKPLSKSSSFDPNAQIQVYQNSLANSPSSNTSSNSSSSTSVHNFAKPSKDPCLPCL